MKHLLFLVLVSLSLHAQNAWFAVSQDLTAQNLWSVAYGGSTLVAVGEQGTILSYSYVDQVWQSRVSGVGVWLVGVGFGNGRFAAVGDSGTILTSDDSGVTWTPRASGTTTRLNSAAYGNGRWLVVGEQGTVLTSTDGTAWTARPALGSGFLRALAFGQGQFLIGGANGVLYSTVDAATFAPVAIATTANIEGAAISANRFWLVGSNGLWASATQPGAWTINPAVTTTTFRGVAARTADEAVAVAEVGAAVFSGGAWGAVSSPPTFLATAVTQGENEIIAVGFNGGIARADVTAPPITLKMNGPVVYGSDVRLVVSPGSNDITYYQWTTGTGIPIPGATSPELDVSHVTPSNDVYQLLYGGQNGHSIAGAVVALYPAGQTEVRDPGFIPALPRLPSLVVPQKDGKLVVAGSFPVTPNGGATYGLARLNADGSLDNNFRAGSGIATTSSITAMHILPDGRIYVRGSFTSIAEQPRPGLARLLPNGALDVAFQPTSITTTPTNTALAPDGRLYVQGQLSYTSFPIPNDLIFTSATVLRLALDGSTDPTFGPLTKHKLVGVDSQGRVLAVDYSGTSALLVRYLSDGTRDSSYATTSINSYHTTDASVEDLAVTAITDSGLYATSTNRQSPISPQFCSFVKFLPDGGRDPSYQSPPAYRYILGGQGFSFAYRPDGGLWRVEPVTQYYAATSYLPTGERDATRYATRPDETDYQILAVAPDGSLLAIGNRYGNPSTPPTFIRIRPITGTAGRLTNLSARAFVPDANDPLIAGFVTAGTGATTALLRGIGPGLAQFNVSDAMRDPNLTLVRDGTTQTTNDNWDSALAPIFTSVGAFPLPPGSNDAAIESSITAGNYTAIVAPAPGDFGTALVELYEIATSPPAPRRFINISARGPVSPTQPLIAGFHIDGDVPVKLLIRAAGPALAAAPFNMSGTLADPKLTLFRDSTALWDNDDWTSLGNDNEPIAPLAVQVGAFPFADGSKDSAMVVTLAPGSYTAVVNGAGNTGGTALVEVYAVP